jgi:hypothetical protein
MYWSVLVLHSLVRWLVVCMLLFTTGRAWWGWLGNKSFSRFDNTIRHWTATAAHLQLLVGIILYCISPIIQHFLHHYSEAVHVRAIRFFGMEHSLMMFVSVVLITIGSASAKRKRGGKDKFRTIAILFTLAIVIIAVSIPWPFSPFAGRPYFRSF